MKTILVVDDERVIRSGLKALLESEGYLVECAKDGEEAIAQYSKVRPDLVLLDVMMPKMNGFAVCERLRQSGTCVPIVFLTAKDEEATEVRALGMGADDFIAKSAPEAVLLARIQRSLARSDEDGELPTRFVLGRVTVDLGAHEIVEKAHHTHLTKTETDILRVLLAARGSSLTKEELIAALRGQGYAAEEAMVYVHISRLRAKLGTAASLLICDRYAGYRLMS